MSYKRLPHWDFGKNLLETGDLDPVYIGLQGLQLSHEEMAAWLLSYWCFYNAGVSCHIVNMGPSHFWDAMFYFATEKAAPRGTERRHFRGEAAGKAIDFLQEDFVEPQDAIEYLADYYPRTFSQVSDKVQQWPLFGPWIAFKVADMLERCALIPVDFSDCELQMYSEPTKGALLIAEQEGWPADVKVVCTRLLEHYAGYKAPPIYDRIVNIQEIETILCKYKSHYNGHYPLGKDTMELHEKLVGWGSLAERMRECLPKL